MRRMLCGSLVMVAAVAAGLLTTAHPAVAGGTWLDFDHGTDPVRPGDTVHGTALVGPGTQAWVEAGPFVVHLRPLDAPRQTRTEPLAQAVLGDEAPPFVPVEVRFVVPELPPGEWLVEVCTVGCTTGIGDLVGGVITVAGSDVGRDTLPKTGIHSLLLAVGGLLLGTGALVLLAARTVASGAAG